MSSRITIVLAFLVVSLSLIQFTSAGVLPMSNNTNAVIKCRQTCFLQILNEVSFNTNRMQFLRCKGKPNCYMCWDYCRVVKTVRLDLAKAMCSDTKFCLKGCRVACDFHQILTKF